MKEIEFKKKRERAIENKILRLKKMFSMVSFCPTNFPLDDGRIPVQKY